MLNNNQHQPSTELPSITQLAINTSSDAVNSRDADSDDNIGQEKVRINVDTSSPTCSSGLSTPIMTPIQSFSDITTLPSPVFPSSSSFGMDTTSTGRASIFRSYNGQIPPMSSISRAASLRQPAVISSTASLASDQSGMVLESPLKVVTGQMLSPDDITTRSRSVSEYVPQAILPNRFIQYNSGTVPRVPRPSDTVQVVKKNEDPVRPIYIRQNSSGTHLQSYDMKREASVRSSSSESARVSTSNTASVDTTNTSLGVQVEAPDKIYEAYDVGNKKSLWRRVRELGKGAFSKVVLAVPYRKYVKPQYQDEYGDTMVAIKLVDLDNDKSVGNRDRIEGGLLREIEIIKSINHPSLI